MSWGQITLPYYLPPGQANLQFSLLGYCFQVKSGRYVQELMAPPVAHCTIGLAEKKGVWPQEVPLPLGAFSSQWTSWKLEMLTWGLFSFVLYSTMQIHICNMLKHPLPVMKYSCPPPKGVQHSKSVCPSTDRQSVLQNVAMGFAVRSSQTQTADFCL